MRPSLYRPVRCSSRPWCSLSGRRASSGQYAAEFCKIFMNHCFKLCDIFASWVDRSRTSHRPAQQLHCSQLTAHLSQTALTQSQARPGGHREERATAEVTRRPSITCSAPEVCKESGSLSRRPLYLLL